MVYISISGSFYHTGDKNITEKVLKILKGQMSFRAVHFNVRMYYGVREKAKRKTSKPASLLYYILVKKLKIIMV